MKWSEVEIGSLCRVARGGSPRPINQFMTEDDDGVNWIKISDATASGKVIRSTKERIKQEGLAKSRAVFAGDFLLSNSMSFGRPYLLEIDGAIHDGWLVLQDMSPRLDKAYLYEALQAPSVQSQFQKRASGTTVKNLNAEIVRTVKIPLPPLEEQRRIAGILDEADRVRKKTQALIDKYDELAQSLFLDMFGDPVTNPKGWEVKCLRELAEKITSGSTPKGGSDVYVDAGIPFFRCQNIWRGYFKDDELALIHLNIHNKNRNSQLRFGDILITKTGRKNTENSSLGRAAMFRGEEGNISTDVIMIRLTEEVDSEFVEFILASNLYRDYIRGKSVGGTDKRHLYVEHVGSFKIILPPREKRSDFINRLTSMRLQLQNLEMMFNCANDAFNSLLQRAFKGELT